MNLILEVLTILIQISVLIVLFLKKHKSSLLLISKIVILIFLVCKIFSFIASYIIKIDFMEILGLINSMLLLINYILIFVIYKLLICVNHSE